MQDQVESLVKIGIPAACINSSLDFNDLQTLTNTLYRYKLIYIAPERLSDPYFISVLQESPISFFVVVV